MSEPRGPSYCFKCGDWPAQASEFGLLCVICYARAVCDANPVPLPNDPEMRAVILSMRSLLTDNS